MTKMIVALDQGTTGSQVAIYEHSSLRLLAQAKVEFPQYYPEPGFVEHEPEDIWTSLHSAFTAAAAKVAGFNSQNIVALGLTNQRETVIAWNKRTGELGGRALVWQDRRTKDYCDGLASDTELAARIRQKTGLVCDPYFSASKMRWMVHNYPKLRAWEQHGELALGTVDSYLLYRLTGGAVFATDHTNASRTMLYDLECGGYDQELLALFGIRREALPQILPSIGRFGVTKGCWGLPDGIPITGCLGDQQAALFGQECDTAGTAKVTYGTGAFFLLNTGQVPKISDSGLLTTVACSAEKGRTFALEGSAFVAGAAVQFLRDNFGWIGVSNESEALAQADPPAAGLLFVPALTGLGAPQWNPNARGVLLGLTRGTSKSQVVRAVLESIALQIVALFRLAQDSGVGKIELARVDGGAAQNNFLMQLQADFLGVPLYRPHVAEATSRGAARAACLGVDSGYRAVKAAEESDVAFLPIMDRQVAAERIEEWERAVGWVDRYYRKE